MRAVEPVDAAEQLRAAAGRLESLRDRTPGGEWETAGLLASRPEVVAHHDDGTTEHVAEARARTAAWIAGLSPRVVEPLISWLRVTAEAADDSALPPESTHAAVEFAVRVTEHVAVRAAPGPDPQ